MVLRRMYGPKRNEVAGGWRMLHNEELHNCYASPNFISVIKLRRLRWTRNVARMMEMNGYNILVGKPEGKNHSEDIGVDGTILLKWILGKSFEKLWIGCI